MAHNILWKQQFPLWPLSLKYSRSIPGKCRNTDDNSGSQINPPWLDWLLSSDLRRIIFISIIIHKWETNWVSWKSILSAFTWWTLLIKRWNQEKSKCLYNKTFHLCLVLFIWLQKWLFLLQVSSWPGNFEYHLIWFLPLQYLKDVF